MAQPRFLFICSYPAKSRDGAGAASGSTSASTLTSASASTSALALAAAASSTSEFEHVAWRLLGANNRELGRSPLWYPDLESCREAIRLLKRDIDGVTSAITAVTLPGGAWSWRLAVSGRPVAVAGRPYLRHRECAYNLSHFVAAVPTAQIADELCAPVPVRR
jgi:hypothetical protein